MLAFVRTRRGIVSVSPLQGSSILRALTQGSAGAPPWALLFRPFKAYSANYGETPALQGKRMLVTVITNTTTKQQGEQQRV